MNYLKKRKLKFLYYSHFSTQRHHIIMFRISNLPRTILQLSIVIVFCYSRCGICLETDTINSAVVLRDDDTIRSIGHQFTLGFFGPNGTTRRYMGIWFNVSLASVAWVANRENPLNDSSGTISISSNGNLVLTNGNRDIMWSTNVTTSSSNTNTTAQLLDSGNLVLRDSSSGDIIWESHRHPDNTFLPTMRISHNLRTGERVGHNTWRTFQDPGHGNFTSGLNATGVPQLYIWENGSPLWRSGPWNGRSFTGITGMYSFYVDGFSLGIEEDGTYYFMRNLRQGTTTRNFLSTDGILSEESWAAEENTWTVRWRAPDNNCDRYNNCGPFSVCYSEDSPICSCLRGYEPRNRGEWNRGEWSGGCVRRTRLQCERDSNATDRNREDGFSRLTQIKVPDFLRWSSGVESECRGLCLRNCSCLAYAFESGIGCMFWNGTLNDVQKFQVNAGSDFYVRVAYSELGEEKNNNIVITVSTIASFFAASICLFLAWWTCKRKGQNISRCDKGETASSNSIEIVLRCDIDKVNIEELPMYSLEVLASATNNFNGGNKLGTGGFGPVYKGKLANGREIAVKRLSAASEQGSEEFMNEVVVISKLQHRNLVRLLGCCVENEEKMLIYEYLQNKSLDVFLFEKTQDILDWRKRFNIIEGIGRGLLYLHRDSRLRIIHRDLKPSNILLDEFWNPKISDFGMARIFGGNQDQANTRKVVGTYGYMAPEYAIGGRFSEKSDVFSFGVLVLEIISGRKNTSFYNDEFSLGLLGYAWKLWNEDNVAYMIDERISNPVFSEEITRCIHIGLLCVQESPRNRPAISTVLSMLSSDIVELPVAEHPGYTERWIHPHDGSPSTDQTPSGNDITHTVLEGR